MKLGLLFETDEELRRLERSVRGGDVDSLNKFFLASKRTEFAQFEQPDSEINLNLDLFLRILDINQDKYFPNTKFNVMLGKPLDVKEVMQKLKSVGTSIQYEKPSSELGSGGSLQVHRITCWFPYAPGEGDKLNPDVYQTFAFNTVVTDSNIVPEHLRSPFCYAMGHMTLDTYWFNRLRLGLK